MPAISSASVRLATTATDTVAPSTIATPLLLVLPLGRSWQHGRTLAGPWHPWKTLAGTSRRFLRRFAMQESVWLVDRPSMGLFVSPRRAESCRTHDWAGPVGRARFARDQRCQLAAAPHSHSSPAAAV